MAFLINPPEDKVKLEDIPVVREYLEAFPKKLNSLPVEREIEFKIELMPRLHPIFKPPYRMAPAELKELKTQI